MLIGHLVWVARLMVAATFALAAWGKLADRASTRQAVREFGVPLRYARVAAWAVPGVELAVAVGVLPAASAVVACGAALVLLVVFSAAIGVQLRQGRHPDCSCFGPSAAPISGWTLARNAGIAALVAMALWGSATHPGLPGDLPVELAVGLAVAVAFGAVQVRQAATIRGLRRDLDASGSRAAKDGLPVGAAAPEFDLPGIDGTRTTLTGLLAGGRPVLLVFLHPTCAPCRTVAGELPTWQARHRDTVTIMPVGGGTLAANTDWAREHHLEELLVQTGDELTTTYRLRGTPTALLIDTRGRIATAQAAGPKAVLALLATPTQAVT